MKIAIIGNGFCGTLLAVHLGRLLQHPAEIILLGKDQPGAGLAYTVPSDDLYLNVSAANMSAFPDQPEHFLRWLQTNYLSGKITLRKAPSAATFAPRARYNTYLREIFAAAQQTLSTKDNSPRLVVEPQVIAALESSADGVTLTTENGTRLTVDIAVLATGHTPRTSLPAKLKNLPSSVSTDFIIDTPWAWHRLSKIVSEESVLIVGTSLTAIDCVLYLNGRGHQGQISLLSRNGFLPESHAPSVLLTKTETPAPATTRKLVAWFRIVVQNHHNDWRGVIDFLRPQLSALWQSLDIKNQTRFLRHVGSRWHRHRHRIPHFIHERLHQLRDAGRLSIQGGRITSVLIPETASDEAHRSKTISVEFSEKRSTPPKTLTVNRIIVATGPLELGDLTTDTLLGKLLHEKSITLDPHKMGLVTAPAGEIVTANGAIDPRLFACGPLRRGTLFESTAVPELRGQVLQLANHLASLSLQEIKQNSH